MKAKVTLVVIALMALPAMAMPGSMSGNVEFEDGYFGITLLSTVGAILMTLATFYLAARFEVRFLLAVAILLVAGGVSGFLFS